MLECNSNFTYRLPMTVNATLLDLEIFDLWPGSLIYHSIYCMCFCNRFFYYEETEDSKVVRNIGNVTASTEVTFEYGVRCQTDRKKAMNATIKEENEQAEEGMWNFLHFVKISENLCMQKNLKSLTRSAAVVDFWCPIQFFLVTLMLPPYFM